MKNNSIFFKNSLRNAVLYLQISLMSHLIEDSRIQSAVICSSGWSIWRISPSYRFIVRNGSILINFLDNWGHFSLIQQQIPTNKSWIKISCNVKAKTISRNFSISCNFKIHRSIVHFEKIIYSYMIPLQHTLVSWNFLFH